MIFTDSKEDKIQNISNVLVQNSMFDEFFSENDYECQKLKMTTVSADLCCKIRRIYELVKSKSVCEESCKSGC